MTTLVNQSGPSNKKKGRSKKANVLSAAVQKATENFIIRGEEIAEENPEVRADMMAAIDEVKVTGGYLFVRLHTVTTAKMLIFSEIHFTPTPSPMTSMMCVSVCCKQNLKL